jgi:hypothetical protein
MLCGGLHVHTYIHIHTYAQSFYYTSEYVVRRPGTFIEENNELLRHDGEVFSDPEDLPEE